MHTLRVTDDELVFIRCALEEYDRNARGRINVCKKHAGSKNAQREARHFGRIALITRKLIKVFKRIQEEGWDKERARRKSRYRSNLFKWEPTLEEMEKAGLWSPYPENGHW